MNRTSFDIAKLETPISAIKTNEIADIYKDSTLLLNVCQFDYSHFEIDLYYFRIYFHQLRIIK